MAQYNRKNSRQRIHRRIRKKISGTAARPRLAVNFSNKNVYAQLIDDATGRTIAQANTLEKSFENVNANVETATKIGQLIAQRAKDKKVEVVVFDRGGFVYHGKVKALADAAREGGLQF